MSPSEAQFEECLSRLVLAERAPAKLMALSAHGAALVLPDGRHIFAFRYLSAADEAFQDHLRKVVSGLRAGRLILLVVGGDSGTFELLRSVRPLGLKRRQIEVLQVDANGELRASPRGLRRQDWTGLLDGVTGSGADADQIRDRLAGVIDPNADRSEQVREFAAAFRRRRPLASWCLCGLCVVIFLLQQLWGGSDFVPTLNRMGANAPGAVARGEAYRLIASLFLHGNLHHLLFNGLALVFLGGFVERLLGMRRFLLLYTASGLAGSAASAALSGAFSVGASGALLGVLAAAAVLAFRPVPGLLPDVVLARLKQNMMINLVLIGVVSLLPRVDFWAHLGGALVGAALMLSGLLTAGLAPLAEGQSTPSASRGLGLAATAACVLLLAGPVWAIASNTPWKLVQPPNWTRVKAGPGVSLELPALIASDPARQQRDQITELAFGRIERDPALVALSLADLGQELAPEQIETEFENLCQVRESQQPEGAKREGQARVRSIEGVRTLEEKFSFLSGLQLWRWSRLDARFAVTVEVLFWPETDPAWTEQRERFISSLRIERI
ncbi:MAG: rhomboid family intramembrane serine protease [Deltaproteobacteria bacterium]|nr:rhomboid family intramembrane serine protease [Deltaproteobacteria bacterium]